jgi:hypothetical protein
MGKGERDLLAGVGIEMVVDSFSRGSPMLEFGTSKS